MRRLHPDPHDPVDTADAYDDPSRAPHDGRPWVYVCMIASVDGATAVDGRSGALGGPGDRAVFAALRGHADLVLVGAGTVRAERYGPPKRADLRIAIVTRALDVDWKSDLVRSGQALIVTTERAGDVPAGVDVIRAGLEHVDLAAALRVVHDDGVGVVMAEGGPTLNGQLIEHGLVDELALTLAPALVGGDSARVAHGDRTALTGMSLVHVLEEDGSLFLRYRAQASGSR
jgi:riboflavin biosynthesis pyrimidine reductase